MCMEVEVAVKVAGFRVDRCSRTDGVATGVLKRSLKMSLRRVRVRRARHLCLDPSLHWLVLHGVSLACRMLLFDLRSIDRG